MITTLTILAATGWTLAALLAYAITGGLKKTRRLAIECRALQHENAALRARLVEASALHLDMRGVEQAFYPVELVTVQHITLLLWRN